MATQCIEIGDIPPVTGKGRRTRNTRNTADTNSIITKKTQTCPGTPSETFSSKLSTSTPASSSSLNENAPRNQPKPQVNPYYSSNVHLSCFTITTRSSVAKYLCRDCVICKIL